MTLQQIFSDNPELLKDKSVQRLIEHCQENHKAVAKLAGKYKEFHDFVLKTIVHSEYVLKKGEPAEETLKKIATKLDEF